MAKLISKWEANDGSVWATSAEALRRDDTILLNEHIDTLVCYDQVDPVQLLDALTTGRLGKMVADFWKVHQS